MTDKLKEKLNSLPEEPGIYKMFDAKGSIIYIGKSKCLKRRVKSYFTHTPKWEKVKKMVPLIKDIEYVVTDTHLEAMLLECKLIKTIKPYFNAQMKNDERYVYLKIEEYNKKSPLSIVHKREKDSYGPFRSKSTLQKSLTAFENIYPIKKVKGNYTFEYHIFPVSMEKPTYEENREMLVELLSNTQAMEAFIKEAEKKMQEAALLYKYETASMYRDITSAAFYLQRGIDAYKELFQKDIVLKIKIPSGYKLFFITQGQVICKEKYEAITKSEQEDFIKKAKEKSMLMQVNMNEKSSVDYRDIIYSEIMKLPEEMVIIPSLQ